MYRINIPALVIFAVNPGSGVPQDALFGGPSQFNRADMPSDPPFPEAPTVQLLQTPNGVACRGLTGDGLAAA